MTALRPPEVALAAAELGAARRTRHSFARSFLRAAVRQRWRVCVERMRLDPDGRGEAVYRVDAAGHTYRFVVFSGVIDPADRSDRVTAQRWDVTAALVGGELDRARRARLRTEVPRQEAGRYDAGTYVLTRANRSVRHFDATVARLAQGRQPDADALRTSPYVLRSTAVYANGRFGLREFDAIGRADPLGTPYRAQMLAGWLLREFAYDLVEHCARARSATAAALSPSWRRFLGIGNATGLGMVPYVITHPTLLDAWVTARELPLAHARAHRSGPDDPVVAAVADGLAAAQRFLADRAGPHTVPFAENGTLAGELGTPLAWLAEFRRDATVAGVPTEHALDAVYAGLSDSAHELRGVVEAAIVEPFDELDDRIEALLLRPETLAVDAAAACGDLAGLVRRHYGWALGLDTTSADARAYLWFVAADKGEPRRTRHPVDPDLAREQTFDVARRVRELRDELDATPPGQTVAELLLRRPWLRDVVARVQSLTGLPYAELRDNVASAAFLPLNVQRFQLARYGMEDFSPRSTDWVRVTWFSGAPRADDVAAGLDVDWRYPPVPEGAP